MSDVKDSGPKISNCSKRTVRYKGLRLLLISFGSICTALGILGVFLPLLPTVPLLLLATVCYARSSDRCYYWILNHRHLGPLVQGYIDGKGIPRHAKFTALGMIWLTIPFTVVFVITYPWGKALLLLIGLGITVYLICLPLRKDEG